MWTHFWDMSSGGSTKLDWNHIYIEAPEHLAKAVFEAEFDRDPDNVTCSCCGPDYCTDEGVSLSELTKFHRSDYRGNEVMTLSEYMMSDDVLIIKQGRVLKGVRRNLLTDGGDDGKI